MYSSTCLRVQIGRLHRRLGVFEVEAKLLWKKTGIVGDRVGDRVIENGDREVRLNMMGRQLFSH